MSSIFYNIEPKVINTELACQVGLNEAIVLQQLHYWIEKNKATNTNFRDGYYWTYGTVQEYRNRDFRFWSFDTVKRTLSKLINMGFLIKGSYNKKKMDNTNWYTINYMAIEEWIDRNTPKPSNSATGQNALIDRGIMHHPTRADYPFPQGQDALFEQGSMPLPTSASCPVPLVQFQPLAQGRLPFAIQENKKEINNKGLNKNTLPCSHQLSPTIDAKSIKTTSTNFEGEILTTSDTLFEEFWKLYPRKESKQRAKRAWKKLNPDQALFNLIANALEYRSQTKEWVAENGRYIPHPATWLNGCRWEDEQDPLKCCPSAQFHAEYGDVLIDGKPPNPIQRYQMEYLQKELSQMAITQPE